VQQQSEIVKQRQRERDTNQVTATTAANGSGQKLNLRFWPKCLSQIGNCFAIGKETAAAAGKLQIKSPSIAGYTLEKGCVRRVHLFINCLPLCKVLNKSFPYTKKALQ